MVLFCLHVVFADCVEGEERDGDLSLTLVKEGGEIEGEAEKEVERERAKLDLPVF